MRLISVRLAGFALTCLAALNFGGHARALAQAPQQGTPDPSLPLTVEMFCSETKLRTTNARIRWSVPGETLRAAGLASLPVTGQTLDVTVYKDGFEKGLLVSLPISQASPNRPVMPQASAQVRPQLRAFQIRLIEVEQPKTVQAVNAGNQTGVVVENLEPGVNYTFRMAVAASSGRMVSPEVTKQARVCPADLEPTRPAPRRKR